MVLDVVGTVQQFVSVFIGVYLLVLFVYLLSTWFRLPYSLSQAQRFLADVCDPYLRFWRRLLPFSTGPIDLSPIAAIVGLLVLRWLVVVVLDQFH